VLNGRFWSIALFKVTMLAILDTFKKDTDAIIRFLDQALVSVGNFTVIILLARALGVSEFGIFSIFSTVFVFSFLIHWSLISAPMQVNYVTIKKSLKGEFFFAVFIHALIISTLSGIIGLFVMNSVTEFNINSASGLIIFSCLFFMTMQEFVRRWMHLVKKPNLAFYSDVLRYILPVIIILAFGETFLEDELLLYLFTISVCAFLGCLLIVRELFWASYSYHSIFEYGRLNIISGQWLLLTSVLQSINFSAPIYVLSGWHSISSAGAYRAVYNLLSPVISISEAFETFLPNRTKIALLEKGKEELNRVILNWFLIFVLPVAIFLVIVNVMGVDLLGWFFGTEYKVFSILIFPISLAMILQYMVYFINITLRVKGLTKYIFYADLFSTISLVSSIVLLGVGEYGEGVAMSVAIAQLCKLGVLFLYNIKKGVFG
jgi:O-antigen/teichoic acid export membrane protein